MIFNSIEFLIFFPLVVLVYFLLPDKIKKYWLLVVSYYFYMCWNTKYAILLLVSTLISYLCGIFLEKSKQEIQKKWIVAAGLVTNLGILFVFKYFSLFNHMLEELFGLLHVNIRMPEISLLLPVGISFYTFQALGYIIDVYRKDISAERSFIKYALFVSFFPQLVAGPIERPGNMLPQINKPRKFDFEAAKSGFLQMLWGFFLKIVIADRIAVFVDTVYQNYNVYPGFYLVVATILFAFQIYCDFYGYSIIALGAAKILGFNLTENFKAPYFSVSVSQFWKNWHISLTSWFRDYIYIPMGGNKKGVIRKYINILVVFLISGLWHGASLAFVVWGGLNGLYQVIGGMTEKPRQKLCTKLHINRESAAVRFVRGVITFGLVDFAWIFFRAEGMREAVNIIKSMLSVRNTWILFDDSLYRCGLDIKNFGFMMLCIAILAFADICKKKNISINSFILKQDKWFQWIFIAFAIVFILTFGKYGPMYDAKKFIYFQF